MCGIIGVVGKSIPEQSKAEKARDVLAHRGPDDEGLFYDPKNSIFLGHRRLSIIDLSKAGRQPIISNDGRYQLIFNGEVYNYLEIREKLKSSYEFKTQTDTEVLLAAYIKWGSQCLQRFNGMFAFAIWDRQKKQLFCARDRFGIKPFYYIQRADKFYFASEIKALLAFDLKPRVNEAIIYDYLYYGLYDHTPETFFQDIIELPAGHYLIWQRNKIEITKYWDLASVSNKSIGMSQEEVTEEFKRLLADAIQLRFRSDVPVGLYLTSGFDSNTLLYYSRQVVHGEVDIFTACSPVNEFNECLLIDDYLSDQQKKYWHKDKLDLSEFNTLSQDMNQIQDQPFGGVPTLAMGALNRVAKQAGIVVLLHGQGLDELFAGYKYYRQEYEKDLSKDKVFSYIQNFSQDNTQAVDQKILDPKFMKQYNNSRMLNFKSPFESHLLNAQYRDIVYTKIPRTLRFSDHLSMHHSREMRVPYLDHRLVEFSFHLSSEYKINQQTQKVLPRKVMHNVVPYVVNRKQKRAYGAAQVDLFRNQCYKSIRLILSSESFKSRPYWNHQALNTKVDRFFTGEGDNSFFLWQCVNLELWMRAYID